MNNNESIAIDYAKAFGITLVVMYHLKNSVFNIYHAYMFHMPLFFFIGGLLFKEKSIYLTLKSCLQNHFIYLVRTFLILGVIGAFLTYAFGINNGVVFENGIIETISGAFRRNLSGNHLFPVAWFLLAYMLCSIAFSLLYKSINRYTKSKFILYVLIGGFSFSSGLFAVIVLAPHYKESHNIIYLVSSQVFFGLMFFCAGMISQGETGKLSNLYIFLIASSLLFVLKNYGIATTTGVVWAKYPDGFIVSTFTGFAGIYATFYIANLIASSGKKLIILQHVGRSSKTIMSYHILSFALLDVLLSFLTDYSVNGKDAYLNHYYDKWTLPVYVLAGLTIPLVSLQFYKLIKAAITSRIHAAI